MNDQTSPTAGGQRPDPTDPLAAPHASTALPPAPVPPGGSGASAPGGALRDWLRHYRPDVTAVLTLTGLGLVLGVLGGMAWYRFAPTVWLSLPADAVSQVKTGSGYDTTALLVEPEAKGMASVDGYFFMITAVLGLVLGVLGFFLARGKFPRLGRRRKPATSTVTSTAPTSTAPTSTATTSTGEPAGAGVGAWAGVIIGGFLAAGLTGVIGHWLSLRPPMTLLRTIADGKNFHAPVTLHSTGLVMAAPVLGVVLFTALTAAFTSTPAPEQWTPPAGGGYFTPENPYGFQQPTPQNPYGIAQPPNGQPPAPYGTTVQYPEAQPAPVQDQQPNG